MTAQDEEFTDYAVVANDRQAPGVGPGTAGDVKREAAHDGSLHDRAALDTCPLTALDI